MRNIKFFWFLLFCFLVQELDGQDIHFSQFSQSALQLNPANAGNFNADLRVAGLHRRQWASVTVPYKTFSLATDMKLSMLSEPIRGLGAGILLNHDEAGDGSLQTMDIRILSAYNFPLNEDSVHYLRAGILFGFSQRSIDFNKLSFDNQYNGDAWDPQAPSGEDFSASRVSWMDLGAGIGWERRGEKANWNAGLSATHLNRPDQSFFRTSVHRPVLWQIHADNQVTLHDQLLLIPSAVFMMQDKFREFNLGAEIKIGLMNEPTRKYSVGFGIHSRWQDAIIPSLAVYVNKFRFGFSYDINTSGLKTVSNARGGPEFSVVYLSSKIKARPQRSITCPVY
ncbi:MAG: PorP/SprF family type IX secretion system membrane protein [Bacteroidia bacterium]|nr:PorP/SprF family type IX secretion system membrane protein [Bacteroidia bacterium]